MKKLFLLLFVICTVTMYADGLEGEYRCTSHDGVSLSITKDRFYNIRLCRSINEIVDYSTTNEITSYNPDGYNFMQASSSAAWTIGGASRTFGTKCSLIFTAYNGSVNTICVETNGVTYSFERVVVTKKEPSKPVASSTNNSSTQPNVYNTNSSKTYTNSYQPIETKIPNINATFGRKTWTYKFYSNGTFAQHEFIANAYGDVREDKGCVYGTYYITQDEYGFRRVYLRYQNGSEQKGSLKYEGQRAVFTIRNIRHDEM